jgi:hypothetical protein
VKPVPITPFGASSSSPELLKEATTSDADAASNKPAVLPAKPLSPAPTLQPHAPDEGEPAETDNGPKLGPAAKKSTATLKTASVTNSLRRTANAAAPVQSPEASEEVPTAASEEKKADGGVIWVKD